ncbi:hypothetical protein DEH80_14980 [Abyssibacter profundi]|uniref:Uncharacterized protein n=1 Tax=Abyssibacter profundi TaxID=2182787 RepID=A0A383XQJ1_9GAMM|nr:hypothetical protein DEH80_14980 [Abyssibacter profundi]
MGTGGPDTVTQTMQIDTGEITVWPENLAIDLVHTSPTIGRIRFLDQARYHEALFEALAEAEEDRSRSAPRAGGHARIEEFDAWDTPEAELLRLRAVKFCRALMNTDAIALQTADVLVVRRGQQIPAYQPERCVASLTYVLSGDTRFLFQHSSLGQHRFLVPEDTRPGDCFAAPNDMVLSVPPVASQVPLMLVSFGFRRLP